MNDFIWLECPECEFDCILQNDIKLPYYCPLCAEDNGRDVRMIIHTDSFPVSVEGRDERKFSSSRETRERNKKKEDQEYQEFLRLKEKYGE